MGITKEPTPAGANGTAMRTTPIVFGLGLIDAVSDRTIIALSYIRHPEGVHGRPAILPNGRVGRFGRKATTASIDEFNAGAFFNEMGVTNSLNPAEGSVAGKPLPAGVDLAPDPELDASSLEAASDFVKFLAPPSPLPQTPETWRGRQLFSQVKCTSCHIPVLLTGYSPIRALSFKPVFAYSDLLPHDLGEEGDVAMASRDRASSGPSRSSACSSSTCSCTTGSRRRWMRPSHDTVVKARPPAPDSCS
jgi:CxxC motif-containing protein (DUF1111 family)